MGIQATKEELHAELLRPDMLDGAPVVLIDGLHHQLDQYGRLVTEFLKVDVGTVAWQSSLSGRKEILHLHAELLRFGSILHVKSIEGAVLTDDTHIGLRFKVLH